MLNDDSESIREMIKLFIDTTIPILEEISTEYQNSNFPRVGELAHKMKPSIDFMEIESLRQVVRDIELSGKNHNIDKNLNDLIPIFEKDIQIVIAQLKDELTNLTPKTS